MSSVEAKRTGAFIKKRSARGEMIIPFATSTATAIEYDPDSNIRNNTRVRPWESHYWKYLLPPTRDRSLTYPLPRRSSLSITFTDTTKEVNRVSWRGRSRTRELLEISNANAKEVEPPSAKFTIVRGLSLYGRKQATGVNATGKPRPVIASFGDRRFSERRNVPLRTYRGTFSSFLKARHYLFIALRTLFLVFPECRRSLFVSVATVGFKKFCLFQNAYFAKKKEKEKKARLKYLHFWRLQSRELFTVPPSLIAGRFAG